MKSEKNVKNLKKEFIKSLSVMVLALTLLVTATVAWFTVTENADVIALTISVEGEDGGVYLGDNVPISRSIILPAATKVDDEEISSGDFAKVIHVETFSIKAAASVNRALVSVENDYEDLHYYIVGNYDPDNLSNAELAVEIQDDFPDYRDRDIEISFSNSSTVNQAYERDIAVVFWADYNDTTASMLENGELTFEDVIVRFSVVE